MATEKAAEQRFAEIYPQVYFKLKNEETFDEEQWQVGLATEVSLAEETLTPIQKDFFAAIRAADLTKVSALIEQENAKPEFTLSVLLPSIDYWQLTNPMHPAQPHYSADIRDLIWNLIILHSDEHTFDELLRWAIIFYQSEDVIQEFIDDLDSVDAQGLTPLHLACFFNQEGTVAFLLAHEACPLNTDKAGNLPLHFACANNHLGIAMRLLKAMTDLSCLSDMLENGTPYSGMIQEILELFAQKCARSTKIKPQPLAATFLEKNGLHATKLKSLPAKGGRKAAPPIVLLPELTAAWNQRVAETEATTEIAQKRQKTDQNESHQAKKL